MSLTPQQIRAAELLAKGDSHQDVGDQIGVSRRTILRWLKQEDFKNLSYGLVGGATLRQSMKPSVQRLSDRHRQPDDSLRVEDLIPDALSAVRDILNNPDARTSDRLKAASLVGDWAGLCQKKTAMHEMEGLEAMIKAGWVPDEVLQALIEGSEELEEKVKNAFQNFYRNGKKNGNKKALLQGSEEGIVDEDVDE